jgi:MinD-like ATPase involved in chromosome partitioning or flagellar assembly
MFTVTFYSFKGGVGRTLALANIALELSRTGRRVLLVDFDLEAPGIDTFEILRPRDPHSGIVEYVCDFMETRVAPDVRDFTYEVLGVAQKGGRLWVMPAGKGDKEYSKKLGGISWKKLYEEFDGFLMFEDLKAQWRASLEPDYVLIDSRTGHTDIEGICTRQLPNAVVVLFFPNEQNLAGLRSTVSLVRSESQNGKDVKLHFVMSNVPDLDDEQQILSGLQQRFREQLGYDQLSAVIHRYDSLSLLNQSLFVVERPKSRLAREYLHLLNTITDQNAEDRQAVVRRLTEGWYYLRGAKLAEESQQKQIDEILKYHSRDGEVLYLLATDLKRRGNLETSKMLLSRSIELGYKSPEAFLAQAEVKLQEQNLEAAFLDVWEAFNFEKLDEDNLIRGIEILRRAKPQKLLEVSQTPAFLSLSGYKCIWVSNELMWSKEGLEAAIDLLSRCKKDQNMRVEVENSIRCPMSLALIGLARFSEAMKVFGTTRPAPQDLDIQDAFNYGMAEWGATGKPPQEMFAQVVSINSKSKPIQGANHSQCLAVALWVVGKYQDALDYVQEAERQITEKPKPEFSCWRYLKVKPTDFREDCRSIRDLIEGKQVTPIFLADKYIA